jgi:hypothetical protein
MRIVTIVYAVFSLIVSLQWAPSTHVPTGAAAVCPPEQCRLYLPALSRPHPGAEALVLQHGRLYVADDDQLLQFALQPDGSPLFQQSLRFDRPIVDLAGAAGRIYVLTRDAHGGVLQVIDTAAAVMVRRGSLAGFTTPQQVVVDQGFAYLLEDLKTLQIVDVRNPDHLQTAASYIPDAVSLITDIIVREGVGYFAADTLLIVDLSDPGNPRPLTTLAVAGLARTVALRGDVLFVGAYFGTSTSVDISDPQSPSVAGTYANDVEYPGSSSVVGTTLFVTGATSRHGGCGVSAYDISAPAAVRSRPLSATGAALCPNDVAAWGSWVYIADRYRGLQVATPASLFPVDG